MSSRATESWLNLSEEIKHKFSEFIKRSCNYENMESPQLRHDASKMHQLDNAENGQAGLVIRDKVNMLALHALRHANEKDHLRISVNASPKNSSKLGSKT
jgi:hypothetical protein